MSLARQVRTWAGRIGLWRKIAIALAIAALASGIATYLALTGAPPFGPRPDARPVAAQSRPGAAAGARRAGGEAAGRGLGRAAARPRRLAAAGPAGRAVQPDRGAADDHRRGVLLPVLQLRRRIAGSATRCAPRSPNRSRSPTPTSRSTSRRSAPMRWRWRPTSTAYASTLQLNPQYLAPVLTAQAAMRGLTEAAVLDSKGNDAGAHRPRLCARLRGCQQGRAAPRRAGRGRHHDRRPGGAGARAGPARRVQRSLSLCRAVHRAAGAGAPRARPSSRPRNTSSSKASAPGSRSPSRSIFILVAMLFLAAAVSIGIHFAAQLADPISRLVGAAEQVARRRSVGARARRREGRRAGLAEPRLQPHDQPDPKPAARADRGQPPARRAAAIYRDGADRRVRRRDRARPRAAASTCRTARPRRCSGSISTMSIGEDLAEVAPEMAGLLEEAARRPDRLAQAQVQIAGGNSTRTLAGAHRRRARRRRDQRLCRDLRRHHRAAVGAAQGGLGRHRPPHRARDQEPADPDPALGRTAAAQIPERDQEGPGDLPHLHRHDRPPCRGYRPDGRRVLVVRADAGAGAEARGPGRRSSSRRSSCERTAHPEIAFETALCRAPGAAALRCAGWSARR